ncbi:hypothetical protein HPB48_008086 [Haemaphysalis longicornis]|uniref:Uncharacterized protein n=1 Tax=Haemaphysalis longicornis TaxID=44386 RepID=A0A9J6GLP9_HAELO|nr:hypothetical protein HPB48_008086 [Haemaphysalis longicornis]
MEGCASSTSERSRPSARRLRTSATEEAVRASFIQFANVTGWDPEPLIGARGLPGATGRVAATGENPVLLLLHCYGDTPADRENIGPVAYSPLQGFRTEFFPYTGHPDYMPPLVAVQFLRPERGVVIGVRCRLLARNPPPGNASTEISFFLFVE